MIIGAMQAIFGGKNPVLRGIVGLLLRPAYTGDGRLQAPADYREWIYLTSGLDMSYTPRAGGTGEHPMFDNVFVNPEAYQAFRRTGRWPDGTMLMLEVRGSESNQSINKAGHSQGTAVAGLEVHVKDDRRGGWAFYDVSDGTAAAMIPKTANCYSCHSEHGAVDTTFVQFYPTLLPIAEAKKTLSAGYTADQKGAGAGQR